MEKSHKSIRIFQSPFLEKFTHVHPITPLVLWVPIIGWLLYRASSVHHLGLMVIVVLGAMGFLLWTLAEYLLHRFVFHFNAQGVLQERLQFIIHGLHHADAQDPTRLVMPPFAAVVLAVFFYSLFRVIFGNELVDPFFAFFLVGYLCYDYIHFAVHHFKPRTRVGRYLKQSHMLHHYVSPNSRWGVSSPFWDYVFGTLEDEGKEKSKEHAV